MNRRSFLLTSTATAVALAASPLPEIVIPGAAPLSSALAATAKKRMRVLGHEMAYIDEGQGRPVIFLHGNPTSSYLWRNIMPHVSAGGTHRTIAPDQMGMGDSDKPDMKETYKESRDYMFAFLDALDLQDAVLVIHDWGSCMGWEYARTRPERIAAVCFMEAMSPPFMPIADYQALGQFQEFIRNINTPGVGENLIMEQNFFLDQFLRYSNPASPLSDETMAEYNRYYPTAQSRKILLDWPREIPIAGKPADVHEVVQANSDWLLTTTFPKLMFHVDPGAIINMNTAEYLKQNLNNLETVFLGQGSHFLQEEYPDEIGKGLADWLTRI